MSTLPTRWKNRALSGSALLLSLTVVACRSAEPSFYTEEQAERGALVYESRCAGCHQADLSGGGFVSALAR